jgi:hypothetical protein
MFLGARRALRPPGLSLLRQPSSGVGVRVVRRHASLRPGSRACSMAAPSETVHDVMDGHGAAAPPGKFRLDRQVRGRRQRYYGVVSVCDVAPAVRSLCRGTRPRRRRSALTAWVSWFTAGRIRA